MTCRSRTSIAVLALLAVGCSPRGMTLAAVGYHLPEQPPPTGDGFTSYTLFLSCSAEQGSLYARLKEGFEASQPQVGDHNQAIWVEEPDIPGPSISKGRELMRRYRIAFGDPVHSGAGPFAIVSAVHPRRWPDGPTQHDQNDLPVAISFGDRDAPRIRKVVECLMRCVSSPPGEAAGSTPAARCRRCGIDVTIGATERDEPE